MTTKRDSCAWALHAVQTVLAVPAGTDYGELGDAISDAAEDFYDGDADAYHGFRYAFLIAQETRGLRGGLRWSDDPYEIAAREEGIRVETVEERIALARRKMFGTLSDRSIRRRQAGAGSRCAGCGQPLPPGRSRTYCATCGSGRERTRRSRAAHHP